MNYKLRPGIVQTTICGVHVLIPSRAAYAHCQSILRLPLLWAATIQLLDKEDADERILKGHRILTRLPDDEIRSRVERFCEEMTDKGVLIKTESEEEP